MNKPLPAGVLDVTADRYSTHQVLNQARPASGFNAFTGDVVLRAGIEREAPWAADRCGALGAVAGDEQVQELARLANRNTNSPILYSAILNHIKPSNVRKYLSLEITGERSWLTVRTLKGNRVLVNFPSNF